MYLINGYLGYGNYGDEVLADLVEAEIKKRNRSAQFGRISSKDSIFEHIKYLQEASELICVGGLFQDKSSLSNSFYYFMIIVMARIFNCRVRIIAQGIGPLNSFITKFFTYLAFKMADWVSVRDKSSSILLDEWQIEHYYGSDLAWLIDQDASKLSPNEKYEIEKIFKDIEQRLVGSDHSKLVAISLRSNDRQDDLGLINKLIDHLPDGYNNAPILILQMQSCDYEIHRLFNDTDLKRRHPGKYYLIEASKFRPEALVYVLKKYCSTMIAMRLHALILARLADLDLVPIACDPKIVELKEQVELYNLATLQERAEKHFALI